MSRNCNLNSGFSGCNDRFKILESAVVPRTIKENKELKEVDVNEVKKGDAFVFIDNDGESGKVDLLDVLHPDHANADWWVEDEKDPAFIKHKPDLGKIILEDDLISLYNLGGISAGDVFPAGMSMYEILWKMLSIEKKDYLFKGIFDKIPEKITELFERVDVPRSELISYGYLWEDVELDNQFYILVVPKFMHLKLTTIKCIGDIEFPLSFDVDRKFNGDTCNMYYYRLPATGKYTFKYIFEEGDE